MRKLWVVGSLNVDFIVECSRFPLPGETVFGKSVQEVFGGKGGNQAVALARLGAHPFLVGALGGDRLGTEYLERLRKEGIRTDYVSTLAAYQTGQAMIEVANGENRITVVPGANAALTTGMVARAMAEVSAGDIVLMQLEIALPVVFECLALARKKGAITILDPAPACQLSPDFLSLVDFITPNETESLVISGLSPSSPETPDALAPARVLRSMGCSSVVQKAGRRGAYLVDAGREIWEPPFNVSVVDTIGAGDSFNAGFAYALSRDVPPSRAITWGNAVGSLSTRSAGAQQGMPTLAETVTLLKKNNRFC